MDSALFEDNIHLHQVSGNQIVANKSGFFSAANLYVAKAVILMVFFAALANMPLHAQTVSNLYATNILGTTATLRGTVASFGASTPVVTIFYGTNNGGTNELSWSNSVIVGSQTNAFSQSVSGLSAGKTYYFTAKAVALATTYWARPSLSFTTLLNDPLTNCVSVLTRANDLNRTGANLNETILNVTNVNTNSFGLLYTRPVDDQVYAQPLIATNVYIAGKGFKNLLIISTVNDSIYAYDADDGAVTNPYWKRSFLSANVVPFSYLSTDDGTGTPCGNANSNIGILSTPVIDPVTGTLYCVARTTEFGTNYVQRLHAISIATGAELTNSPKLITASVAGTGDGNVGGVISFDPRRGNQRASLCLVNGTVYICWASHCDWGPYHGWIMGYDAQTLQQKYVLNTSPNDGEVGVWMAGAAPAADTNGFIYVATANGPIPGSTNAPQQNGFLNDAYMKLAPSGNTMIVVSYYTPWNYSLLDAGDQDLGSSGVMLIPGTSYAFGSGKTGLMTLVDRNNMGGCSNPEHYDFVIEQFLPDPDPNNVHEVLSTPVWWDGPNGSYSYIWPMGDPLYQMTFHRDTGLFDYTNLNSCASNLYTIPEEPGGSLSISANGTNAGSGVIWGNHVFTGNADGETRPGILQAFNAENVSQELWNSEMVPSRDRVKTFAKFVPPTIANGKVYLPTFSGTVNVYGLLSPNSGPPVIKQQPYPATCTRYTGAGFQLSAFALGANPMKYQWKKNGTIPVPGATNGIFNLTNLKLSDVGQYSCTISNSAGVTNTVSVTLSVIPPPSQPYPQLILSDNPMAYWRLGESKGTVAYDYVGGYNGKYTNVNLGQLGFNSADPDSSAAFGYLASSNSYVGGIPINLGTPVNIQFSVEAWVNGDYSPLDPVTAVAAGQGLTTEQWVLGTSGGQTQPYFQFNIRDINSVAATANTPATTDGKWHHLVGVCDEINGVISLYLDGTLSSSSLFAGDGIQDTPYPVSIGERPNGAGNPYSYTLKGAIDEVAIYNYALNATQVAAHYAAGTNLSSSVALNLQNLGTQYQVIWPFGTLQSAPTAKGPYTDITNAVSPYYLSPTSAQTFFRIRVQH